MRAARGSRTNSGNVVQVSLPDRPHLIPSLQTLNAMDQRVASSSWTVVGGLMVHLHCAEAGIQPSRTTEDIDLAVDVFVDRTALYRLTEVLRDLGFQDVTPDPLTGGSQLSYRWQRDGVKVDLMVPERAGRQRRVARTITARRSVELPAVQQAVMRSDRVAVMVDGLRYASVRRPNVLGAVVIKAVASTQDRRDPDRHREDLVMLGAVAAGRPDLARLATQVSPKDRKRLRAALDSMPERFWQVVPEPAEAKSALMLLTQRH